mmetsp:Transcript_47446/g.74141  ORF Transcript_47446/g.74141 Transcript_47446/m.74141 type:complete len:178 (-) Transcript_47446:554-1087(-)
MRQLQDESGARSGTRFPQGSAGDSREAAGSPGSAMSSDAEFEGPRTDDPGYLADKARKAADFINRPVDPQELADFENEWGFKNGTLQAISKKQAEALGLHKLKGKSIEVATTDAGIQALQVEDKEAPIEHTRGHGGEPQATIAVEQRQARNATSTKDSFRAKLSEIDKNLAKLRVKS